MSKYSEEKERQYQKEVELLLQELPECCHKYIGARQLRLSVSSQRAYLLKYKIFFEFLCRENEVFFDYEVKNIPTEELKKLTSDDILEFLDYSSCKSERGQGKTTKDNILAILSSLFTYLCRVEKFTYNPVSAIERSKTKKKEIIALDFKEREAYLQGLANGSNLTKKELESHNVNKERDYAINLLFLDTGMRVSELVGLDLNSLNFNEHYASVTRKGGDFDIVYMSEEAEKALHDYLEIRTARYKVPKEEKALFVTLNGRISVRAVQAMVKKAALHNVPGKGEKISVHKLRSTFATGMLKKTGNVALLQQQLGHRLIETSTHYARADKEDMKSVRNILSE